MNLNPLLLTLLTFISMQVLAHTESDLKVEQVGDMLAIVGVCVMFALGWIAGQQR